MKRACTQGMVMEKIMEAAKVGEKRVIYLGDGTGDFCPSLKLKHTDFFMPRKNYPVWDLICQDQNQNLIKAHIHEWSDGDDLHHVLLHLITTVSLQHKDSNTNPTSSDIHLVSVDCNKLQKISVTAH